MFKTQPSYKQNTKKWKSLLFKLAATITTVLNVLPAHAVTLNPGDILVTNIEQPLGGGSVIRVDPQTGAQTLVSSGQFFSDPLSITLDASGNILVADVSATFNDDDGTVGGVIRVDPQTGAQTPVSIGEFEFFSNPTGITLDGSGNILTTILNASGVVGGVIRVDPQTGTQTPVSTGQFFDQPFGITVDASGNILVADLDAFGGAGGVIRVDPQTGTQTPVSTGQFFSDPTGITLDTSGNILVANSADGFDDVGSVIRVDPQTGTQTLVSSGQFFIGGLFGITLDASGNILVTDFDDARVIRVDPQTGAQTLVSGGGSGLSGITVVPVPVPEPSSILGLLTFGSFCSVSVLKRRWRKSQRSSIAEY